MNPFVMQVYWLYLGMTYIRLGDRWCRYNPTILPAVYG